MSWRKLWLYLRRRLRHRLELLDLPDSGLDLRSRAISRPSRSRGHHMTRRGNQCFCLRPRNRNWRPVTIQIGSSTCRQGRRLYTPRPVANRCAAARAVRDLNGGCNSVVECHLAKVDVEGSSPFTRSFEPPLSRTDGGGLLWPRRDRTRRGREFRPGRPQGVLKRAGGAVGQRRSRFAPRGRGSVQALVQGRVQGGRRQSLDLPASRPARCYVALRCPL
jgi:hypothetical protein